VPALLPISAIPGVFPPLVRGDALLADGGLLNNLPVDVAERMGAQRVIAVQLSGGLPLESWTAIRERTGAPDAPATSLHRSQPRPRCAAGPGGSAPLQHPPALLLRPDVTHIGTLDMTWPEEGRRTGEAVARATADSLLALRAWRLEDPAPALSMHERLQTVSA
jgi:NTE family protein